MHRDERSELVSPVCDAGRALPNHPVVSVNYRVLRAHSANERTRDITTSRIVMSVTRLSTNAVLLPAAWLDHSPGRIFVSSSRADENGNAPLSVATLRSMKIHTLSMATLTSRTNDEKVPCIASGDESLSRLLRAIRPCGDQALANSLRRNSASPILPTIIRESRAGETFSLPARERDAACFRRVLGRAVECLDGCLLLL